MPWWAAALLIIGGYLLGALPAVYLLALRQGVDLRRVGSGNVGGSNLWQHVGPRQGAFGGLIDIAKGTLPVVLGRALGFDLAVAGAAGLAAAAGQIWPVFLGFNGGRGNSAGLGMAIALSPVAFALGLIPATLGSAWKGLPTLLSPGAAAPSERWRFRHHSYSVPLGLLGTFALMPLASRLLHDPSPVTWVLLALAGMIVFRRLTAVGGDHSSSRLRGLLSRLFFDRP